jgi:hypothetical protein
MDSRQVDPPPERHRPRSARNWNDVGKAALAGAALGIPLGWIVFAITFGWAEAWCSGLGISYAALVRCWLMAGIGICAAGGASLGWLCQIVFTPMSYRKYRAGGWKPKVKPKK